ncbi:MAG: lipid II flippase MurJ [Myxococcota bacterium]
MIYERGAFGRENTLQVTMLLSILICAIPAWIGQQIISRAFYARGDTWRPMLLDVIALGAIPLYWFLGKRHGLEGLAWAGVLGMSINMLATLLMARWLHGAPSFRQVFAGMLRMTLVAVVASTVAFLLKGIVLGALPATLSPLWENLIVLFVGGGVFLGVAGFATHLMGDEPSQRVLRRLLNNPGRRLGRGQP